MQNANKQTKTIMIQGTTSDAGKSVMVAGLCRLFARKGYKVAPFKPQNMALNSAVTPEGGEIGRAQAVQAQACFLQPHTDMNPVLLKPNSDIGAQVIIHGKACADMDAQSYHQYKKTAMQAILESHQRLREQYDLIIVEGAGSPAEINLRENDVANMGFAEAVDCPVLVVADIDKGGVFAHLYGTLKLLSESEQQRIKGFIINRFRGDISLLEPGNRWLERETRKPVAGVIPYLHNLHIEAEDAISLQQLQSYGEVLKVVVPVLPRISNHTDFDPLRLHPQVDLKYIGAGADIPAADLIILPGSKSVRQDLQWLKDNGWVSAIERHLRYGGKVLGICGGLQMLGQTIHDPLGIEGTPGSTQGLGYFNYQTTLEKDKCLQQTDGVFINNPDIKVNGYEIHAGKTTGIERQQALIRLHDKLDGILSSDQQIMATYLHGLFNHPEACEYLLGWAGLSAKGNFDYSDYQEQAIERVADALEDNLDMDLIHQILQC